MKSQHVLLLVALCAISPFAFGAVSAPTNNPSFTGTMTVGAATLDTSLATTAGLGFAKVAPSSGHMYYWNGTAWTAVTSSSAGRGLLNASAATAAGLGLTNGSSIDSWGAKTAPSGTVADQTYVDGKLSDTAYNATTWDGDTTHAATKNAVRDKVESLDGAKVNASGGTLTGGTLAGSTSISGSPVYTVDAITVSANAGTVDVSKPWSSATFSANVTLTPSAAGTANTPHLIKLVNSDGSNARTATINNSGTDYTKTVPASSSVWWPLVSNGTDWVPVSGDPGSASVATTSRIPITNPTTGVESYDTAAHLIELAVDNTAYNATTWNGDTTHAPSKDAVRDKIESITGAGTPAPINLGNLTGTVDIDWSAGPNGQLYYGVLTGSTTFTFSNATSGQFITVDVAQTGTNTYTVTWPSAKWPGGAAPTMTAGAAASDTTTIYDLGGTYKASSVQDIR